jgi:hypothetical protein
MHERDAAGRAVAAVRSTAQRRDRSPASWCDGPKEQLGIAPADTRCMPVGALETGIGDSGPRRPVTVEVSRRFGHTYATKALVRGPAAMLTSTPKWGTIDQVIEQMFDLFRAVAMMGWRAPE